MAARAKKIGGNLPAAEKQIEKPAQGARAYNPDGDVDKTPPPPESQPIGAARQRSVAAAARALAIAPTVTSDERPAASANELAEDIKRIRKIRRPRGSMLLKLALPPIPGYFIHWFNDTAGRIDEAERSGFAHIIDLKSGKPTSLVVGVGRDGQPLRAYAMKIPEVFHQEDMDARHAEAQAKVDVIKKNPFLSRVGEAKKSDAGKFYNPQETEGPLSIDKGQ